MMNGLQDNTTTVRLKTLETALESVQHTTMPCMSLVEGAEAMKSAAIIACSVLWFPFINCWAAVHQQRTPQH
jgi:hypothetical protein